MPFSDTYATFNQTPTALTMEAKRRALAAFLSGVEAMWGDPFRTDFRPRDVTMEADSAAALRHVMGMPEGSSTPGRIRYRRISWEGEDNTPASEGMNGEALHTGHRFRVVYYAEYIDADTYEDSSQYAFERLVEGMQSSTNATTGAVDVSFGVLPALRQHASLDVNQATSDWDTGGWDTGARAASLGNPVQVSVPNVPLPLYGREIMAHYLDFVITIGN